MTNEYKYLILAWLCFLTAMLIFGSYNFYKLKYTKELKGYDRKFYKTNVIISIMGIVLTVFNILLIY